MEPIAGMGGTFLLMVGSEALMMAFVEKNRADYYLGKIDRLLQWQSLHFDISFIVQVQLQQC